MQLGHSVLPHGLSKRRDKRTRERHVCRTIDALGFIVSRKYMGLQRLEPRPESKSLRSPKASRFRQHGNGQRAFLSLALIDFSLPQFFPSWRATLVFGVPCPSTVLSCSGCP